MLPRHFNDLFIEHHSEILVSGVQARTASFNQDRRAETAPTSALPQLPEGCAVPDCPSSSEQKLRAQVRLAAVLVDFAPLLHIAYRPASYVCCIFQSPFATAVASSYVMPLERDNPRQSHVCIVQPGYTCIRCMRQAILNYPSNQRN